MVYFLEMTFVVQFDWLDIRLRCYKPSLISFCSKQITKNIALYSKLLNVVNIEDILMQKSGIIPASGRRDGWTTITEGGYTQQPVDQ